MKNSILKVLAAIGCVSIVAILLAAGTYTSVLEWRQTPRMDGTLLPFQEATRKTYTEDVRKRLDFSVTCSGGTASVPIVNSDGRTRVWNTAITGLSTSSTLPCTDYWDIRLLDDRGIDILGGYGADRRNTIAEGLNMEFIPRSVVGGLTVEVTSASGVCIIHGSIYYK